MKRLVTSAHIDKQNNNQYQQQKTKQKQNNPSSTPPPPNTYYIHDQIVREKEQQQQQRLNKKTTTTTIPRRKKIGKGEAKEGKENGNTSLFYIHTYLQKLLKVTLRIQLFKWKHTATTSKCQRIIHLFWCFFVCVEKWQKFQTK